MGSGGSQEAEYALKADIAAGTYKLVCDGIIIRAVDVTFDLVHRRDGADTLLATAMQHFEPLPGGAFTAQACDIDMPAPAVEFLPGDEFIFRYTGANTTSTNGYIPNGDGHLAEGRIPNITLPK